MGWAFKPKLPDGATFNGEIVWPSTGMEIPDTFRLYVENVTYSIRNQFDVKYTGFETKKYKIQNTNERLYRFMLVGDLPRWMQDALLRLAVAMNGAGMILQFKDNWISGTDESFTTYDGRWLNAGDFVDNSELLCGGSIEYLAYTSTNTTTVTEFQKVINTPGSGLEWELKINDVDATDNIYYRVI